MPQIGCHLNSTDDKAFADYAKSLEVTRTALLALIIQREMRVKGLPKRADVKPGSVYTSNGRETPRLTVHINNRELKAAFTAHVKERKLTTNSAVVLLIRIELKEQWFFKTLGIKTNHY